MPWDHSPKQPDRGTQCLSRHPFSITPAHHLTLPPNIPIQKELSHVRLKALNRVSERLGRLCRRLGSIRGSGLNGRGSGLNGRGTTRDDRAKSSWAFHVISGFHAKRKHFGQGPGTVFAVVFQLRGHFRVHEDDLGLSRPRQRNAELVRVLQMLRDPKG
jgi:hypothetical protein